MASSTRHTFLADPRAPGDITGPDRAAFPGAAGDDATFQIGPRGAMGSPGGEALALFVAAGNTLPMADPQPAAPVVQPMDDFKVMTAVHDVTGNGPASGPPLVAGTDAAPVGSDPVFAAAVTNPFGLVNLDAHATPALADIDADGDLDAFVGGFGGQTLFFRNTGSASAPAFTEESSNFGIATGDFFSDPTLADIDADGDLDAFLGGGSGITLFYRNTGTAQSPAFTAESSNFGLAAVDNYAHPTLADIDADGDLDAFIGQVDGAPQFFRNTGSASAPAFTAEAGNFGLTDVGDFESPTFADIDGDGDLDAFVGEGAGNTLFFRNTGSAGAPAFTAEDGNFGLTGVDNAASPTLADLDADGDLDALIGGADGVVRFFLNTAPGVRVTPTDGGTAVSEGGAADSYAVVLNLAPTADVVVTLSNTNGQVATNVGTLTFNPVNWNIAQTVWVTATNDTVGEGAHTGVISHTLSSADPAYDGLAAARVRVAVTDNDLPPTDPQFGAAVGNAFGLSNVGSYASPTLADIDGDGDLDAFIGSLGASLQFFRNSGGAEAPTFVAESSDFGPVVGDLFSTPTFADIDADGDLDAFVGGGSGNTVFHRNTGSATAPAFAAEAGNFGLPDAGQYVQTTLVDIDADGDLDAFIGTYTDGTQFFRNTGSATAPAFTAEGSNFGLDDAGTLTRPTFADIDGDGDLDAFIGNEAGQTRFFRNTGDASAPAFTAQEGILELPDMAGAADPEFVDIDADGDLDAFIGNSGGDTSFVINNSRFALTAPGTIAYTDTAADDYFPIALLTLATRGSQGETFSYGILGGTDGGDTVSLASAYGELTVTKASGVTRFVPDDAAIDALGSAARVEFTVTVTNGSQTESKTLRVDIQQSGATETPGNDSLTGGDTSTSFDALGGNDTVVGGSANDYVAGGSGSDSLNGGGGADSLSGGSGNDRYTVDNAGDAINETSTVASEIDSVSASLSWTLGDNLERLTLTGGSSINAQGNSLANTITGNSGDNLIRGGGGNDTLAGGGGNDVFDGGGGNDRYTVDSADDYVIEVSSSPTEIDSVTSSVAWTLGSNLEKLTLSGSADIDGTGNALANTITGNAGFGLLAGGGGNDTIYGNGGDTLDGGSGDDSLVGSAGNDTYIVDSAFDVVVETDADVAYPDQVIASLSWTLGSHLDNLTLTGSAAINGTGNALDNALTGNSGNNLLGGGDGNDWMSADLGNDTLLGGLGQDDLTGGDGNDTLLGEAGSDTLAGSDGDDLLLGAGTWNVNGGSTTGVPLAGDGADSLIGGAGNDQLRGNAGNDTLLGGAGSDNLRGDTGNDLIDGGDDIDLASYRFDEAGAMPGGVAVAVTFNASVVGTAAEVVLADGLGGTDTLRGVEAVIITGSAFADRFTGSRGGDQISGKDGNDTIDGGDGNDQALLGEVGNDSVSGGAGADTLDGGADNDTLSGGDGNDVISGGDGADAINGGLGNDSLEGGIGNDSYTVDSGTDVISETTTVVTEIDSVTSSVSWTLGSYLENLTLTGSGTINGSGNTLANKITGTPATTP